MVYCFASSVETSGYIIQTPYIIWYKLVVLDSRFRFITHVHNTKLKQLHDLCGLNYMINQHR